MRSAWLGVVMLLGCGGGESETSSPDAGAAESAVDAPSCGFAVGQRICDLPLVGHVRDATTGLATTEAEAPFTLRDVFARGTQRWVFIHTSAFW